MKAVVLYESMFGHTRQVAEAIASGLSDLVEADAIRVGDGASTLSGADLVVIGVPTHAHSIPRPRSRAEAAAWAKEPERKLTLEPGATGRGIREWLKELQTAPPHWAAFATRTDLPRILAGDGAAAIEHRMRRFDAPPLLDRQLFLVSIDNELLVDELDHARAWGGELGRALLDGAGT